MIGERFQEILSELERFDFQEMLNMTRNCLLQVPKENETQARFEVCFLFNWNKKEERHIVEAERIIPLLIGLPEESRFCLSNISINPFIIFFDADGVEQKYKVNEALISYSGDIQPHWRKLRFQLPGGVEQTVFRSDLSPGCVLAQTPTGSLKVFSMDGTSLTLMVGTQLADLVENNEYMKDCLLGVKAALFYDHDEFSATWQWLFIDDETEGEPTPWYRIHRKKREELSEGMEFVKSMGGDHEDPTVKILEIKEKSVTLLLRYFLRSEIIVLDQPNKNVVIWKKGKRSLNAKLHVPEPNKKQSYAFESDPLPSGCLLSYKIVRGQAEPHEYKETKAIRLVPNQLRPENYDGESCFNWPYVWGFTAGKMVVGMGCPKEDYDKCIFLGMLSPGQQYSFSTHDFRDWKGKNGKVVLNWENAQIGFEIKDGKLMSVSDQKEIVLPEEVNEMHFGALLSAPSLRQITIHSGVTNFSCALEEFHKHHRVKLDVAYEGSLQQWFDTASGLAGNIGHLVIQGKAYGFYETEDLVIPEGVSRVGKEFFCRSEVLRSVVLPPEVVEIGDHAFAYCNKLQSVKVLGPASIGPSAFISCDDLSDIYLADGVVSLGASCFSFLTKVESIFIPLSVERVGCISEQNDADCRPPVFRCAAPSQPSGWSQNWNLLWFDSRFGFGHGHDFYHKVFWGQKR